jgi:hypothetical protein
MTAKIIHLEQFSIGCRHHANGVRFPLVYRVTGFEFDLVNRGTEHERFVPGKAPVAPFYTLSRDGDFGVADPTFRPVKVMEAGEDEGCIAVRHHTSRERAEAYIEGVGDLVGGVERDPLHTIGNHDVAHQWVRTSGTSGQDAGSRPATVLLIGSASALPTEFAVRARSGARRADMARNSGFGLTLALQFTTAAER